MIFFLPLHHHVLHIGNACHVWIYDIVLVGGSTKPDTIDNDG
jgi:hypothetical protein